MAEKLIGQGEGNLVPDSKYKKFLLDDALGCVVGDAVALIGATGYTVAQTTATTDDGIGFVMEAVSDGDWVTVCVGGYCAVAFVDTDTDAGDYLDAGATDGVLVSGTTKTTLTVAVALAADVAGYTSVMVYDKFGA